MEELEKEIDLLRIELIKIAKETGINSHDTLSYSQKLDELITIYQKSKIDNIQKVDQKSFFHYL
ncbi:Spo0E family sporulation regulatory protein-aspartic acid phosphatase [Metabacillus litoralis]|uniref:Spo0E family sporulation regulatory protein-aspartic acid phosphatase n=1 Tax=Metabacillus litoralis TaxID=152268 RepID=UPI00203F55C6|nr:aspartyl-phosphate phosphatase Spo0E family protein [Metabacillus litoralis]MCM3655511.1 aspartyl-phosphate phosphatase Spo0E family protein [Metabacillus litoralis]